MKKLFICLIVLFLGLVFSPKNLEINAADVPGLNEIYDVDFYGNGDFKLTRPYPYDYFDIYYYFDNVDASAVIKVDLVNLDYLYYVANGDYYIMRIQNDEQFNLNMSYDMDQLPDGLYWSNFNNDHGYIECMNLKTKVVSSIIEYDFSAEAIDKMYKLDYIFYNDQIRTFYLFILIDGQLFDISDILTFFNIIGSDYKLFKVTEKTTDLIAKVTDSLLSFDLYFNITNLIDYKIDDYLLYSYDKDQYSKVLKKDIDSLAIDIIDKTYNYLLYEPTIADYMQMVTDIFNNKVKEVYGMAEDTSKLNGLYVVGNKNELFKIFNYDYEKRINDDKTDFVKTYMLFPHYSNKENISLNIDFINNNTDYSVYETGFWNVYGYNPLSEDNNTLVAFINNYQIDISNLSTKDVIWLFDFINSKYIDDIDDYNNYLSKSIDVNVTNISKYNEVPNGKGFVKFIKKDKFYDSYFYVNDKYYYYKDLDMISILNDDIETYKIRFEKTDTSLILEFSNVNETLFWDLINEKWITEHQVFVTGEKLFTSDIDSTKGLVYSYVHFNLNIDPEKITNVTFNTDTRLEKQFLGNKTYSEWKNVTLSIDENMSEKVNTFDKLSLAGHYLNKANTYLKDSIKVSDNLNYDWQVLLNYDYHTFNNVIVGSFGNALINDLGLSTISREYNDLTLMEISYWKDGIYHEHVDVDDKYPSDGKTDFSKGLLEEIKVLFEKLEWLKYVALIVLSLIAVKFISWLLPKRRYRR